MEYTMKNIIWILIVIIIIGGMWYFASQRTSVTPVTPVGEVGTTTLPAETGTTTGTTATTTKEFTVEGSNFKFNPSELRVNQGDTVKITFKNSGGTHDFKIDEFKVASKRLSCGQSEVVEFVADKAGSFQYYCSVGTHRQMG